MDSMLALRTFSGIKIINYNDIFYCRADGRYTQVFIKDGKSILTARLLKSFENKLPGDIFLRIHKSYIINLNYITDFSKNGSAFLVLGSGTKLEVSKRRKKEIFEKLNSNFIFV